MKFLLLPFFLFPLINIFAQEIVNQNDFAVFDDDPPFPARVNVDPIQSNPPRSGDMPLSSFVETETIRTPSKIRAGFEFGGKYAQVDTLPYSDIFLSPYIEVGPWFFSYEIPLRFDWTSAFVTEIWTKPQALISKIENRLFYKMDDSIFRFIQFDITSKQNITQGHGRIFYNYNPNLYGIYEPVKSLVFAMDLSYFGFNYTIANIANPHLMGGEVILRPLMFLKNTNSIYRDWKIYAVYGLDLSPFKPRQQSIYEFTTNPNSPSLSVIEVGTDIPLVRVNNIFDFFVYADFSTILGASTGTLTIETGSGVTGGLLMTFANIVPIRFEISQAFGPWNPRLINEFYHIDSVYGNTPEFMRDNHLQNMTINQTFFTTSLGLQIVERAVFLNVEVFGDLQQAQDLWMTVSMTLGRELLKLFTFDMSWTTRQLNQGVGFTPNNSILSFDFKYHMLPNMSYGINWRYSGIIGQTLSNAQIIFTEKPYQSLGMNFTFRY